MIMLESKEQKKLLLQLITQVPVKDVTIGTMIQGSTSLPEEIRDLVVAVDGAEVGPVVDDQSSEPDIKPVEFDPECDSSAPDK